ncbi:MAG TPA: hypothetical protein VFD46_04090 [Chryseolinea sp.]|nr:hypothetical protein [Chryseolinea sp.]
MKFAKSYFLLIMLIGLGLGCSDEDPQVDEVYTGNESTYPLESASEFDISGAATFKERVDGGTDVFIVLDKTFDTGEFPVHLHFGDVTTDKAEIALLMLPVAGNNGTSKTTISSLSDESKVTFNDLKEFDGCLKIHLAATGEGRDIVLAAGNIGKAFTASATNGRVGMGVCKSE